MPPANLPSTDRAESAQHRLTDALVQAALALNSSLDLDRVLDGILEQTVRVVPCRSANVMLVEGDQARIVRHLDCLETGEIVLSTKDRTLPLTTPALQQMVESGRPLLFPDTSQAPGWITLAESAWIRSYAAAPLVVCDRTIGFLNVNGDQANALTPQSSERLLAFAAVAAAALHNARLYQALQRQNEDLEERVSRRTRELSTAKEHIEAILASVPDAVFVLGPQLELVEANTAGQALLAQAEGEGISLFDPIFLGRLQQEAMPEEKAILLVGGRSYQARTSSLQQPASESVWVVVLRDVTRFRELDELKTRFISDVSHELRTPLSNLTIYLDLLSMTDDPQKQAAFISTLQRENGRLTRLIEDLLTISRLESGRLEVHQEPVDAGSLVSDLVCDRNAMASENDLFLSWAKDPGLPLVLADPHLLIQILSNLLTNSIHYTLPGGTIRIYVKRAGRGISITVADTGVGIEPEEMGRIFDRFWRGSASLRTGAPGTGIGLSISHELAQRMGGRITVESRPGQGSAFTVWLPAVL